MLKYEKEKYDDSDNDVLTEEQKREQGKIKVDKEDKLALLKTQLAETKAKRNKINILFVLEKFLIILSNK